MISPSRCASFAALVLAVLTLPLGAAEITQVAVSRA